MITKLESVGHSREGKLKKAIFGRLHTQAVDMGTGLLVGVDVFGAHISEQTRYEPLLEDVMQTTGIVPYWAGLDRAYTLKRIYSWNNERGITTVSPYRMPHQTSPKQRVATKHADHDGVVLCEFCGGGTDQESFLIRSDRGRDRPVVRVRCTAPTTPACKTTRERSLSHDPLTLVPVWRTHAAHHSVDQLREHYEFVHDRHRDTSGIAHTSAATRAKRFGSDWMTIQSLGAAIVDWARALIINGWVEGVAPFNRELRPDRRDERADSRATVIAGRLEKQQLRRSRLGRWGDGLVNKRPIRGAGPRPAPPPRAGP